MPQLNRSASLTGFADLARALGLDPRRLAEAAGVPAKALADPDLQISTAAVGRLLTLAAQRAGIDDFGLRLAEKRRLSNLGALALVVREQPSLRKALDVIHHYQWMQTEGLSLQVEEHREIAVLSVHFAQRGAADIRQAAELSIGVLCRAIRELMGKSWRPEEVLFRHGRPARYDVHRRVFAVTPLFEQEIDALVIRRAELDAPLPAADPVMARHAERYIDQLAGRRDRSMRERVGELIVLLLPTGTCTAEQAARHLGFDRRTLHRRLALEHATFEELVDEKRGDVVRSLISDRRRSLTAVAVLAGFASASSFSHWFRRRFNVSPREYRARHI